jgi:MFS family permease
MPTLRRLLPTPGPGGLWRHADFVKLWGSLTITHFGGHVTFLALPLTAALILKASPFELGLLTALEALPFPLFGLFAGVLVDRSRKLPVIICADIGRGLALIAVPACAWLGILGMPVLYATGFLVATGTVIGWPAYQVFMTERVGRQNLAEANAKIGISDSAAQLVGPGLAGALIHWLTAPFAVLVDACGFFASAWVLRGIPPADSDVPKIAATRLTTEIRDGLRSVWRDPVLRALAWALALWQVFRHAFAAVIVLFAARELKFTAGYLGVLFMAAGIGSLAASGAAGRCNARFGFGPTMLAAIAGTGVAWLILGSAAGTHAVASLVFGLGLLLLDFSAMIFFINYLTLRQSVTPDALLGRVTATMIALSVSAAPLGGLAGGWIAERWGLRAPLFGAGIGALGLALLVARISPIARLRVLEPVREPALTESVTEAMPGPAS